MKLLTVFSLLILGFAGCTSAKYEEMQNARDRLRAAHEDAVRKTDPRSMQDELTQKLLGTWQFVDIAVAEGDLSEELAALKYERNATIRQNLTIAFFMDQNVFRRYRGVNGGAEITGTFKISAKRYGNELLPYLRVFRDTGERFPEFISGVPPNIRDTPVPWNWLGVSITGNRLYLILAGVMELTPQGWAQSRGVRCTFKRIK